MGTWNKQGKDFIQSLNLQIGCKNYHQPHTQVVQYSHCLKSLNRLQYQSSAFWKMLLLVLQVQIQTIFQNRYHRMAPVKELEPIY